MSSWSWDANLCDYDSPLFEEGFALGQTMTGGWLAPDGTPLDDGSNPLVIPPRRPEWSDAEWATFAEACMMGSCEHE